MRTSQSERTHSIVLVYALDFHVMAPVIGRLIEHDNGRKERPRDLRQQVKEAAVDENSRDVDATGNCHQLPFLLYRKRNDREGHRKTNVSSYAEWRGGG